MIIAMRLWILIVTVMPITLRPARTQRTLKSSVARRSASAANGTRSLSRSFWLSCPTEGGPWGNIEWFRRFRGLGVSAGGLLRHADRPAPYPWLQPSSNEETSNGGWRMPTARLCTHLYAWLYACLNTCLNTGSSLSRLSWLSCPAD